MMLTDAIQEVIFIGLPGPTHNYGGLSTDNMASSANRGSISHPKTAVRQVIGLIRLLRSLGITVAVLPPQMRPHMPLLHQYFSGEAEDVIRQAAQERPELLEKASSSSAMWVANAATVTPGLDSTGGQLHLTVANLHTNLHRRIEAAEMHRVLAQLFEHVPAAKVHPPLAASMPDEGDANHMRLAPSHGQKGLHVLVYGMEGASGDPETARQSKAALETILRQHEIPPEQGLLLRQNPEVIAHGVFHNDVIAVSNEHVLLAHEEAYAGGRADIQKIAEAYGALHRSTPFYPLVISKAQLSVAEAVKTYFFNSQIVSKPDKSMAIIAPVEVRELYDGKAARIMQALCEDGGNPISEVHYLDLRQSMRNGGGPACLRLRVPMTGEQVVALAAHTHVLADDALMERLERIVEAYYPEQLTPQDVKDPRLHDMCKSMLAALYPALKLRLV